MAGSVFVSFDHQDLRQLQAYALLKQNPLHPFECRDHCLTVAEADPNGGSLELSPRDPRSGPVRDDLIRTFERCSKLIVLIGEDSWQSAWVAWEIDTFHALKHPLSGERTWWRIRGMTLKGCAYATIPQALNGQSTKAMPWDPEAMDQWLGLDPDA